MKAFRSKLSNAASKIKDSVERSVLADEFGGGGGSVSSLPHSQQRRNSKGGGRGGEGGAEALDEDNTFVRLPLEAARKIRCFSKGDVGEIIARHLKEKEELLGEILVLRDLCLKCAPHTEVKKVVEQSKMEKIAEVTKVTNSMMLLSAKDEIEKLRNSRAGNGGGGGGGQSSEAAEKKIAALEWRLEEAESEVTMLREEIDDVQQEKSTLQKELQDQKVSGCTTLLLLLLLLLLSLKSERFFSFLTNKVFKLIHFCSKKAAKAAASSAPSSSGRRNNGATNNESEEHVSGKATESSEVQSPLPVDFDFFSDSNKTPDDKKVKGLEAKLVKLQQELEIKCVECDAVTSRLNQSAANLQAQQRKNKEIQKQYRMLKAKQSQQSAAAQNGGGGVSLKIQVQDGGEGSAEKSEKKSNLVLERLEYEIQEMRSSNAKLVEEKKKAEDALIGAREENEVMSGKLAKQQKIGKNQKSKIDKMQLDLAHEQGKTREALKEVDSRIREIDGMKKKLASSELRIEKHVAKESETRQQLSEATEQLFQQKTKQKNLEKNKNQSMKEHSKEVQALTSKLEAANEETEKLKAAAEEYKDTSSSMEMLRKEGETLKSALDAMEKQMSDEQKEHHRELQDLRDSTQDELQQTLELLREMEMRACSAEESAQNASADLEDLKKSQKRDSSAMIANFSKLILSEDRSTWAEPLCAAVNTIEERASGGLRASLDQAKIRLNELEMALESAKAAKEHQIQMVAEMEKKLTTSVSASLQEVLDSDKASQLSAAKQVKEVKEVQSGLDEDWKAKYEEIREELRSCKSMLEAAQASSQEPATVEVQEVQEVRESSEVDWKVRYEESREELKAAKASLEVKDKELKSSRLMARLGGTSSSLPEAPSNHLQEQLDQANKIIISLQQALEDSERTHQLRTKSEQVLKEEIYEMQRSEKRGKVDLNYLKNVVLKGFESGELSPNSSLTTVLSRLLEFSPEDLAKIPKQKGIFDRIKEIVPSSPKPKK